MLTYLLLRFSNWSFKFSFFHSLLTLTFFWKDRLGSLREKTISCIKISIYIYNTSHSDPYKFVFFRSKMTSKNEMCRSPSDQRQDRVYAIVDNDISSRTTIYLNRKPQMLQISGKPHVIQFDEDFKTVTINGHPFKPLFGGFPMVISVLGKKHFVRLTALPPSINLKNLCNMKKWETDFKIFCLNWNTF